MELENVKRSISQPFFIKLGFKVGADFIMHNRNVLESMNSPVGDMLWNFANQSLILYMISEPDSNWRVRQFAASLAHFHRFTTNLLISGCDSAISQAVSLVFPTINYFSSYQSCARMIRRMYLTMKRNGGVYEDMFKLMNSFAHFYPSYLPLFDELPIKKRSKRFESPIPLIESELKMTISHFFNEFQLMPIESDGCTNSYKAQLKNGENVTITVMQPRVERMRKFDLIPFKLINFVFDIVPGLTPERNLMRSFINRLDFSLGKEYEARVRLLEILGVKCKKGSKDYIDQARKLNFPIFIPAPYMHLCTPHVMITDFAPTKIPSKNMDIVTNVGKAVATLLSHNCIVSDLSISNLRFDENKISLARYSAFKEFDSLDEIGIAVDRFRKMNLRDIKSVHDSDLMLASAEALGNSRHHLMNLYQEKSQLLVDSVYKIIEKL